jgi:hypothetical protein
LPTYNKGNDPYQAILPMPEEQPVNDKKHIQQTDKRENQSQIRKQKAFFGRDVV